VRQYWEKAIIGVETVKTITPICYYMLVDMDN